MAMTKRTRLGANSSTRRRLTCPVSVRRKLASFLRTSEMKLRSLQNVRKIGYVITCSVAALVLPALAVPQSSEQKIPAFSDSFNNGEIRLGVQGFGTSGGCSLWSPEGHGNWNIFQSCQIFNPTELQVYPNAAEGASFRSRAVPTR